MDDSQISRIYLLKNIVIPPNNVYHIVYENTSYYSIHKLWYKIYMEIYHKNHNI